MGDRIVSPVAISSGMAAKVVKDLAAKEALCVLVQKQHAEEVLQGGSWKVCVRVKR